MSIIDHISNISFYKRKWRNLTEAERKTANAFLINKFMSMSYKYISIINETQQLNLPVGYLYDFYISIIPKQKKYFKYIKKNIKESKETDQAKLLAEIFEVSEKEAKDYVKVLDKKQLDEITEQVKGIKEKKKK